MLALAGVVGTHLVGAEGGAWRDRAPLNMAHQGGALEAPSNTMFAFRGAHALGADVLEPDVHATADRRLVVVHDDTVDRTTDGTGRVADLTLAELRELDAAHWFVPGEGAVHDRAAGDYPYRGFATGDREIPDEVAHRHGLDSVGPAAFRIPTLREVLATFPETLINVEIKATAPDVEPYEAALAALLRMFDRGEDTVVASFHPRALDRFREHDTGVHLAPPRGPIRRYVLTSVGPLGGLPLPRYDVLQVPRRAQGVRVVTRGLVADAHADGLAVHVWTVNDPAEMRRLLDLGVDGLITDRPAALEGVLADRRDPGGSRFPYPRSCTPLSRHNGFCTVTRTPR